MKQPEPILVTGGAGFIGSHLCASLLQEGNRVICLDNFNSFYDPRLKRDNIRECLPHKNFSLVEADIRDTTALSEAFELHRPGLVIHLAAMAGVRPSIDNPGLYAEVNVLGTLNLLQQCAARGIGRFIFASSSSVYGNNEKIPFSEEDSVDHPISPYAATKKAGELLCYNWHHLFGISTACLRFFTVYGPRQRPDLAIRKFARLISRGEPIPVYGDGSTARDYTYIGDILGGIRGAIDLVSRGTVFEIINLGNDRTVTLSEMIRALELASGLRAKTDPQPMQPGDVERTWADIAKARKLLGYQPQTSFAEGIRLFWEWLANSGYA